MHKPHHCRRGRDTDTDTKTYTDIDTDFGLVDSFLRNQLTQRIPHWTSWHGLRVNSLLDQLRDAFKVTGEWRKSIVVDQFRGWLLVATSSIDALMDLMAAIQQSVSDGSVDSSSTNGLFLRSCSLGFDELSFESVIDLYKDFREEVADPSGAYVQKWTRSSEQMETSIREHIWSGATENDIVNVTSNITARGSASSSTQTDDLQYVLNHNPELPAAHFLRFILCLSVGERVGAIDSLHQYMDYVLSTANGGEDMLQFSSILLAVLHDQFGECQLLSDAIDEAVRVAQQSQDTGAVAFALGWLALCAKGHESRSRRVLLQRCVQRAGPIRSLMAGANLALAAATNSWSGYIHALADLGTGADSSDAAAIGDRPTHSGHMDDSQMGRTAATCQQKLVAAGIWKDCGRTNLAAHTAASVLHCHFNQLCSADCNVVVHHVSDMAKQGSMSASYFGFPFATPSEAEATSTSCIYGNALREILGLRHKALLSTETPFNFDIAIVLHEWAVRCGNLEHAVALMNVMESHLHPRLDNFDDIIFDVECQKVLLQSSQGLFDETISLLDDAIGKYKMIERYDFAARLLLRLAVVSLNSNQLQFKNAIRPLLDCLILSKNYRLDALYNVALTVLAQVHLCMGQFRRAVAILQKSLPRLLQQEHVWLQATAYLALAKCRLKEAHSKNMTNSKRNKILLAAIQDLKRSELLFLRCQDMRYLQEVYYLLASAYHLLPDSQDSRDLASERFISLRARNVSSSVTVFMNAFATRDGLELAVCS